MDSKVVFLKTNCCCLEAGAIAILKLPLRRHRKHSPTYPIESDLVIDYAEVASRSRYNRAGNVKPFVT